MGNTAELQVYRGHLANINGFYASARKASVNQIQSQHDWDWPLGGHTRNYYLGYGRQYLGDAYLKTPHLREEIVTLIAVSIRNHDQAGLRKLKSSVINYRGKDLCRTRDVLKYLKRSNDLTVKKGILSLRSGVWYNASNLEEKVRDTKQCFVGDIMIQEENGQWHVCMTGAQTELDNVTQAALDEIKAPDSVRDNVNAILKNNVQTRQNIDKSGLLNLFRKMENTLDKSEYSHRDFRAKLFSKTYVTYKWGRTCYNKLYWAEDENESSATLYVCELKRSKMGNRQFVAGLIDFFGDKKTEIVNESAGTVTWIGAYAKHQQFARIAAFFSQAL